MSTDPPGSSSERAHCGCGICQWQRRRGVVVEVEDARQARQQEYLKAQQRHQQALDESKALLLRFLDEENRRTYASRGEIHFTGSDGRRYVLHNRSYSGNVTMLDADGRNFLGRFCAHPPGAPSLPIHDVLLAQYLMLKTDAAGFLKVALPA